MMMFVNEMSGRDCRVTDVPRNDNYCGRDCRVTDVPRNDIFFVLFFVLFLLCGCDGYDDAIVKNSVLSEDEFNPNVVEVVSEKNNVSAYLFENNNNPIVSIDITFVGAGNAQNKLTNILSKVLTDDKNLQEELEINGISFYFSTTLDDFGASITAPKKSLDKAINLFVKTFYSPDIKQSSIEKTKQQLLIALKRQQEHPSSKLSLLFNKALYGKHPYGQNPLGSEKTIYKTTKKDLLTYLKTALAKDNLIVSVAGDVNSLEVENILDEMFAKLPEMTSVKALPDAKLNKVNEFIEEKSAQNIAVFATPAVNRLSKDFYPLYMANYILGGSGLSSKLSQVIREKNGLVYSIYSYLALNDKSNVILFSFSTAKENYKKAMELFKQEINDFEISKKELNKAKETLIAYNNLRFAEISEIAIFLTYMQKEGLGLDFFNKRNDYIKNVNEKEIKEVINKYYDFNKFNHMSIGEN